MWRDSSPKRLFISPVGYLLLPLARAHYRSTYNNWSYDRHQQPVGIFVLGIFLRICYKFWSMSTKRYLLCGLSFVEELQLCFLSSKKIVTPFKEGCFRSYQKYIVVKIVCRSCDIFFSVLAFLLITRSLSYAYSSISANVSPVDRPVGVPTVWWQNFFLRTYSTCPESDFFPRKRFRYYSVLQHCSNLASY